jgi:D-3-phosphoglycerate dehydrogenase / 2-oxoglutarate reductase
MSDPVEPLILDLLEWIGRRSRPYAEVLEVWRTSCPRLPVWEEANNRGFIDHIHEHGQAALVAVSSLGFQWLAAHRRCGSAGTLSQAQVGRSAVQHGHIVNAEHPRS